MRHYWARIKHPKYILLIGYGFSRFWSLINILIYTNFATTDEYAAILIFTALFGVVVNPISEAIGHLNLKIFPSESSIKQNLFLFIVTFCIIYWYYVKIAEGEGLDEDLITILTFVALAYIGTRVLEFRHILRIQKKYYLVVTIYSLALPVATTVMVTLLVLYTLNTVISLHNVILIALVLTYSIFYLITHHLRNAMKYRIKTNLNEVAQYTLITFSSGQLTNIFIIMLASNTSSTLLVEISIILKFSKFIVLPNMINSQIALVNLKHALVSGDVTMLKSIFYEYRAFTTVLATVIAFVLAAIIFINEKMFTLDFGELSYLSVLFCSAPIFF